MTREPPGKPTFKGTLNEKVKVLAGSFTQAASLGRFYAEKVSK